MNIFLHNLTTTVKFISIFQVRGNIEVITSGSSVNELHMSDKFTKSEMESVEIYVITVKQLNSEIV